MSIISQTVTATPSTDAASSASSLRFVRRRKVVVKKSSKEDPSSMNSSSSSVETDPLRPTSNKCVKNVVETPPTAAKCPSTTPTASSPDVDVSLPPAAGSPPCLMPFMMLNAAHHQQHNVLDMSGSNNDSNDDSGSHRRSCAPNAAAHDVAEHLQLYKTTLCSAHRHGAAPCTSKKCTFAHGLHELRTREINVQV
eukprot:PhM_4_TR6288/c4_g2_i2/m.93846